jgi:hypothetical protein
MTATLADPRAWLPVEDAELLAIVAVEEDFEDAAEALGRPVELCVERFERLTGHAEPQAVRAARVAAEQAMVARNLAEGGFARQVTLAGERCFVARGGDGRLITWRAP